MDDSEITLKKKQEKPANILDEIAIIEDKVTELQNMVAKLLDEQEDAILSEDEKREHIADQQLIKTRKLLTIKIEQLQMKNSLAKINIIGSDNRRTSIYDQSRPTEYLGEARKKRIVVPSGLPKFRQGTTPAEPVEFIEQFQKIMEAHEIEEEKYSSILALCLDSVDGQWLEEHKN